MDKNGERDKDINKNGEEKVSIEKLLGRMKEKRSQRKEKRASLKERLHGGVSSMMKKEFTKKAGITALIVALFALLFFLTMFKEMESRKPVKVSGNIEATYVRLAFRVQGQIDQLLTDEGMIIRVGEVVAKLDPAEYVETRNNAAASLMAERYNYELALIDYKRAETLFEEGSVSTQQRDQALTKAEALKSSVEALAASLSLADTRLGYTDLTAPLNGYVLVKSAEAGEVMQVGSTVFTVADMNDIWLTAYINERDLGKVKLNQRAYVTTDTYPHKKYIGWVSFISQEAEFTPKYIQTTEERVKLVYRIKIRVDNSSLDLKPGMPGDGYIQI